LRSDVGAALRQGRIVRVRKGRNVLPGVPVPVAAAVRLGGRLAGISAARSYGLWAGFDRRTHVSVPRSASRLAVRPKGLVVHWDGTPPSLDSECWRVDLATCLRQVAKWCDRETALATMETAVKILTVAGLRSAFVGEPIAAQLLAGRARVGCDSGPESVVSQRLERLGIRTHRQVRIAGVGHVDLLVVGTRVVIEVDGRAYHDDPDAYERDRRRDAELVRRGYVVLRLSYEAVTRHWAWCERAVVGALAAHSSSAR
jgi:very-short-patch-repair endonuclease